MKPFQPLLACFSIFLVLIPALPAQQPAPPAPAPTPGLASDSELNDPAQPTRNIPTGLNWLVSPYQRRVIKGISMADSSRLESLIRAGRIYLSLQDAIALALENNLDIEVARYGPMIADTDVLRSQAGGLLRGVQTTITPGPNSTSSPLTAGAPSAASLSSTTSANASGSVILNDGFSIPSFDPQLTSTANWLHQSTPQSNTITTGTNNLYLNSRTFNTSISQAFQSGTSESYGFNYQSITSNNAVNTLNPNSVGSMNLTVTQHLLQGFGFAVNNRNIRIAKLNRRLSDLVFEQQVITTIAAITNLYWDLVSFSEDLRVKRSALQLSQKLYEDNKKQVEIGTLAKIEVTRAEAEMASNEQDLTISETNVLQQEAIIKNALTRNGMASPAVYAARIVPTDSLRQVDNDPIPPVQDLMEVALRNRPELLETKLGVETNRIGLAGSRSELLPALDLQGVVTNNGLAGDPNYLRAGQTNFAGPAPSLIGGFDTILGQIFRRNYPTYSIAFQLNVPLRNRQAQADIARDSLTLRQAQLREHQQINQVRLDVQTAQVGLLQGRSRFNAAVKARKLQEESLDAEQKKYALGASTIFLVIQAQRDLATAEGNEVTAMANYMHAKTLLELATGQVLSAHSVKMDEARNGVVSRTPDIPKP